MSAQRRLCVLLLGLAVGVASACSDLKDDFAGDAKTSDGLAGDVNIAGDLARDTHSAADADNANDLAGDAYIDDDSAGQDLAAQDGAGDAASVYVPHCQPVGKSYTDGFFALATFNGKLYAGQFGYGQASKSMLYRYAPWELTKPGLTGITESVCAMKTFKGHLYANTEDSGDIYRSADGQTWTKVYNGVNGSIGCGLAELGGKLYALNYKNSTAEHGKILVSSGGAWATVYDSGSKPLYLRELVAYKGTLYAFGVEKNQGKMLTSTNGTKWAVHNVSQRFFRGHVYNGFLWLGSNSTYTTTGKTAIWRYDGSSFIVVHTEPKMSHIADLIDLDGKLYASTASGFKKGTGPSKLLMSPDNGSTWKTICNFSEAAVWSMSLMGGELYVGSWHYGKGGTVYKVTKKLSLLTKPIGSFDGIKNGVAWGWACDTDTPGTSIQVHIYVGGKAGAGKGYSTIASLANEAAVNKLCGGGTNHRFSFTIPSWTAHMGQKVYAYGINTGPGGNALLSQSPLTVK